MPTVLSSWIAACDFALAKRFACWMARSHPASACTRAWLNASELRSYWTCWAARFAWCWTRIWSLPPSTAAGVEFVYSGEVFHPDCGSVDEQTSPIAVARETKHRPIGYSDVRCHTVPIRQDRG